MRFRLALVFVATLALGLWVTACGDDEPVAPAETDTAKTAWEEWASFPEVDPERIPSKLATNPGEPWGDYIGSEACKRCHEEDYHKWRGSFHSRTLYDATQETVFGDFSGTKRFDDPEAEWIVIPFSKKDEQGRTRFYMDVRFRTLAEGSTGDPRKRDNYKAGYLPDLSEVEFEIIYAFGNRKHQPYVIRDKRGLTWVAPVYWDDVVKEWRYDGWRPYVRSCGSCHVTGIKTSDTPWFPGQFPIQSTPDNLIRYSLGPGEEGWAEGAVGCETCHGPGRAHLRAVESIGVEEYRRQIEAGTKKATIYDGKRESFERRLDACGQCHNFHTESSCTWVPGPEGFDRDPWKQRLEPASNTLAPGELPKVTQFYLDGSDMSPCTIVWVYQKSKMHAAGISCVECHDPHGSDYWPSLIKPIHDNSLCIECHDEYASVEAQTKHSRHLAGSPGNRCVECHMPRIMEFTNGVYMMGKKIHSHEFSIPTGIRRPGGPNASCNICHVDRNHQWTQEILAQWAAEKAAEEGDKAPGRKPAKPAEGGKPAGD